MKKFFGLSPSEDLCRREFSTNLRLLYQLKFLSNLDELANSVRPKGLFYYVAQFKDDFGDAITEAIK